MPSEYPRRSVLAGGVTLGALALAGCTDTLDLRSSDTTGTGSEPWQTVRGGLDRVGVSADQGPTPELERAWTVTPADVLGDAGITHALSSPVTDGEWLYVTLGTVTNDEEGRLVALETDTGDVAWTVSLSGPRPATPPVVRDGMVYTLEYDDAEPALVAVDVETEERETATTVPHDGALTVTDELVIVEGTDLTAYDRETLEEQWDYSVGRESAGLDGTPLAVADETGFVSHEDGIDAISLEDGEPVWQESYPFDRLAEGRYGNPAIAGDTGYCAGGFPSFDMLESAPLVAFDCETGEQRWEYHPAPAADGLVGLFSTPAVQDDTVYAFGWSPTAALEDTGRPLYGDHEREYDGDDDDHPPYLFAVRDGDLEWAAAVEWGFNPILASDVIFASGGDGVTVVSTDGDITQQVDEDALEGNTTYHDAVVDEQLLVPTDAALVAFD